MTWHPLRTALGILGALLAGALLATQARINGELGTELDDGVAAALISFGSGLLVLLVASAALPAGRRGARRLVDRLRSGQLRPAHCVGGLCGGYLVCTQGLTSALLGVSLFTVAVVCGQMLSGLLVDRWGVGPAGPQPLTAARIVGSALALVAVVIAMSSGLGGAHATWLVVLPLVAGLGLAWQQAANGRVQQASESATTAATLNFLTGTLAIAVVFAVEVAVRGLPNALPSSPVLYAGGPVGVFVVGGAAVIVRHTGVLLLSMGMVGGQLLGAGLLDLVVPVSGARIEVSTLFGIALTLVAVVIAAWPSRASGRPVDLSR